MNQFITTHLLDIITTLLGLLYIVLEYKASIWLWLVGIIMPALDIILYWQHGLYADAGMAVYYVLAAVYGYFMWQFSNKNNQKNTLSKPITHMPKHRYLPALAFVLASWAVIYYILIGYTDSNVPLLDSFTNALSFVALWALARKHVEQWLFWIAVDLISASLYIYKGIPFKAGLYILYVIIAVMGYIKWKQMAAKAAATSTHIS